MSDVIMALSEVMRAEINSLNVIANNTANINTVGYRSERAVLNGEKFIKQISGNSEELLARSVELKNGSLSITTRPTDLAIQGNGWFVINTKDGKAITRNGHFTINNDNMLVTKEGHFVQSSKGDIEISSRDFRVLSDGSIMEGGGVSDALMIVAVDTKNLDSLGNGLYRLGTADVVDSKAVLVQGALENSNVDTANDMVRLMEATRHVETLQRAMSAYDQLLNTGINQLGK